MLAIESGKIVTYCTLTSPDSALLSSDLRDQLQATLSGNYTIERELGGGGMSRVFLAEDTRHRRKVVIKVLSPELAQGISVERFEREIQTAAALQQANIVPVLTSGNADGVPYFTMPFVEGESLRARLARGPLSVTEVIGVLRDVTRALAYAHQRGVVHRDIKPDNVLLSGGAAVVTDFGIAKAISASRTASASATLTQVGTSIGTPAYMAPEQAAGDPDVDHRADIYALGAMAYELLSGQPVFAGRTAPRMLAAHMGEAPTPITTLRGDLPPQLAELVMRCLAKDPADRPQQASDIAQVLETITSGSGMPAMPPVLLGGPGMFKKALAIYAVAFAAVAILAKAAIVGIGLPDWVFPGALIVMALGLPVVLWTGYVQRVTRRAMTMTPTFTPGGSPSTAAHGTMATMALRAAPKVSWHRTARGGIYAIGGFVAIVVAFMLMRAFNIGPAATLFGSGRLKAKDPIVMTDFSVTNGDTSLARVVSFAVRTGLSQSAVLTIMDQAVVAGALERMERPPNTHVDVGLAQQVALREGAKAIVDGEVTTVGSGYVLTLRLLSADSARVLASFQSSGEGPKGLIDAADKVARDLRAKAGESLRSVQNTVPLARASTASLEALRRYSEAAFAVVVERNDLKAVRLARDAVTIDPSFAQAWNGLAISMTNAGLPDSRADSAYRVAYGLRNRLPEGEQAIVEGFYFAWGPGHDRLKAIAALDRARQIGPATSILFDMLAAMHRSRREFAAADSLYRLAIAADSTSAIAHAGLTRVLLNEGRLAAADSLTAIARRRFPQANATRYDAISQSYYRGQFDAYLRQVDSAVVVRDVSDPAAPFRAAASLALLHGQLGKWREYLSQALAADSTVGRLASALSDAVNNLVTAEFVHGDTKGALSSLEAALAGVNLHAIPDADRPDLAIAQALAMAGRTERARAIVSDFQSTILDTTLRRFYEPAVQTARAVIALAEHKPAEAISGFRRGDVAADGPVNECIICLPDNLSRAFDAANEPDSAIAAYEKYIGTPMWRRQGLDATRLPAAHERLGQLYEAKGNADKAAEHYRAFIELWKNADPALQPRVAEARRRLARLTPVEKAR